MTSPFHFIARLRALLSKRGLDADLDDELAQHLEAATEDNLRAGMTPAEARRQARLALGGLDMVRELHRDTRGLPWLEDIMRDVRHGLRSLGRSPGFSGATILILALGIGGVTALFSTLHAVLVQPLPYRDPARLVLGRATYDGDVNPWASGADYADYRDKNRSLATLEAFGSNPLQVTVTDGQTADRVDALQVTPGFFQVFGGSMAWGRPFDREDGKADAAPVVVVSHALWQQRLADEAPGGRRTMVIDGATYDVVGATGPDFHFVYDVDVWFPTGDDRLGPRRFNNWFLVGRLADGVTLAQAQSDVDVISAQLAQAYPDTNTKKGLLLTPLQEAFAAQYDTSFRLLGAGTLAILLIACANAAGLLLARGATRQTELAVRAAIGASGWRLVRLLLTEALLLAAIAGAVGIVLTVWMQKGLLSLLDIETVLIGKVGISVPVLLFAMAATALTGLGSGLLPAWRARRIDLAGDLRSAGRGTSRQGLRLRGALVVGQVTATFVLLVVAALLMRSFASLHRSDPGFEADHLLTADVPLPPGDYAGPNRTAFFAALQERVRALPGVRSVGFISQLPVRNPYNNIDIFAADSPPPDALYTSSGDQRVVLPGYFEAMEIPLLAGRDMQAADSAEANRVVVLSERLAKELFPDRNPLGLQVVIDRQADTRWEVVGIVGDVKQDSLRDGADSLGTFYRSHGQRALPTMRIAVRTSVDPYSIVPALRGVLREMDSRVPLSGLRTMDEVLANSTGSERAQTLYLAVFSSLALVLAAVGIHGLLAYAVTQRRRDIGVRMALGASRGRVAGQILREAGVLVLAGMVLGSMGAVGATVLIRASLYGIGSIDPFSYVAAAAVLVPVAALAAWLPARRAANTDPMITLRSE